MYHIVVVRVRTLYVYHWKSLAALLYTRLGQYYKLNTNYSEHSTQSEYFFFLLKFNLFIILVSYCILRLTIKFKTTFIFYSLEIVPLSIIIKEYYKYPNWYKLLNMPINQVYWNNNVAIILADINCLVVNHQVSQ